MADCCIEKNLGERQVHEGAGLGESYRRCTVCNRRHFEVILEPFTIGVKDVAELNDSLSLKKEA